MHRKGRRLWDKDSEKAMLLIWGRNIGRLRSNRKNGHIVAEMVEELKAEGFEFTPLELKTKIQNLTSHYRKVKRGMKTREVTCDGWDIIKEMDNVFKPKKKNDSESFLLNSTNRRRIWDRDSEKALLQIWSRNIGRLRSNRKNGHIVAEMVEELKAEGFEFTSLELKTKIQNLTSRYRKVKKGIQKSEVTCDGWDIIKEMDNVFKPKKKTDSESFVLDSINNINSSISTDPLMPAFNSIFPLTLDSSSAASPLKPPDSPMSHKYSDSSSSSDTSFTSTKKKRKKFDKFFENLEQTMEKINQDIKTTIDKIITIEEEKRDVLKVFAEKEGEVQDALLEFLKRH